MKLFIELITVEILNQLFHSNLQLQLQVRFFFNDAQKWELTKGSTQGAAII